MNDLVGRVDIAAASAARADMIVGGFQGDPDVWRKVEQAFARHRIDALTERDARIAELEDFLTFIADHPEPDDEQTALFYRIRAGCLQQVAAKALGRQTVSQEAMDWAGQWAKSKEGRTTLGEMGL